MSTRAVIGLQWGDEGKGKIVDWLAEKAQHIARFQGGHNAGHTIYYRDRKTVLHLLPSGVLHPHSKCYIGNGVVISPPALLEELAAVRALGIDLSGRLFVAHNAALVLPYHIAADQAREVREQIGTTGRGIGPAHEDKIGRRAVHFYDVIGDAAGSGSGNGREKFFRNTAAYNRQLEFWRQPQLDADELWQTLQSQCRQLQPYLCDDIPLRLQTAQQKNESILLECAQGTLLDIELGTYPYTTSASCIAAAHASGLGVELSPQVVGISKAYSTRVGNGPFPTELTDDTGKLLSERGDEFGATTGRARRCGWLDIPFLRHAVRVNNCRQLYLTKLDILDALDEIQICVAYEHNGKTLHHPPADPGALGECRPVYETHPGWKAHPIAGLTQESDLPENARRYLARIAAAVGTPITTLSTGPHRHAIIPLTSPE